MWIALAFYLVIAANQAAPDPALVRDKCETALAGRTLDGDGYATSPEAGLVCFRGELNAAGVEALVAALQAGRDSELVLFADSRGGEPVVGVNAAAAVLNRRLTIVTGSRCAYVCANALFLPSARRFIGEGSVVVFGGGVPPGLPAAARLKIASDLRAAGKADEAAEIIARGEAELKAQAAREVDILRQAGVRPDFLNVTIPRAISGCLPAHQVVTPSTRYYAANGVKVEQNRGPQDQASLDQISRGTVCYAP